MPNPYTSSSPITLSEFDTHLFSEGRDVLAGLQTNHHLDGKSLEFQEAGTPIIPIPNIGKCP